MLMRILIGNIISLAAMILLFSAASKKDNYELIRLQGMSHIAFAAAGLFMQGYSGVIQDIIGFLRNFLILNEKNTDKVKILLLLCGVIFGLYFNNKGIIGMLPVFGTFQYTTIVSIPGVDNKKIQLSLIINAICMTVYNGILFNYTNVIANVIVPFVSVKSIIAR